MENLYTPNKIRTYTGKYVDPLNMTEDDICIEDIAHALSQIPRFGGHLPQFYSVAQHSVLVCSEFTKVHTMEFPTLRIAGLLHDASEAYLLDIPKPIKDRIPEYGACEEKIMCKVANKYDFDYPLPDAIKRMDTLVLEMEWNYLMLKQVPEFICWSPEIAERAFLQTFKTYFKS